MSATAPDEPGVGLVTSEQRRAGWIVGCLYLSTMASAVFAESFVRGRLVVPGDAARTAANILAAEGLFRAAIVADLVTACGVVALVWALYLVLSSVDRQLALLAVLLRLVECSVSAAAVAGALLVPRVLTGAAYQQAFEVREIQGLARLLLNAHGAGVQVGFVFLGLGSAVFAFLWLRSGYVPRVLALLGIGGSFLLSAGSLASLLAPRIGQAMALAYMLPLGVFEVVLGAWLVSKGLRQQAIR